jgi:hypothetical protein
MATENSKYDTIAMSIYETHRRAHPGWAAFFNMKRKERDYWRGLGEVAQKNNLWNPPDDVDIITI